MPGLLPKPAKLEVVVFGGTFLFVACSGIFVLGLIVSFSHEIIKRKIINKKQIGIWRFIVSVFGYVIKRKCSNKVTQHW